MISFHAQCLFDDACSIFHDDDYRLVWQEGDDIPVMPFDPEEIRAREYTPEARSDHQQTHAIDVGLLTNPFLGIL